MECLNKPVNNKDDRNYKSSEFALNRDSAAAESLFYSILAKAFLPVREMCFIFFYIINFKHPMALAYTMIMDCDQIA